MKRKDAAEKVTDYIASFCKRYGYCPSLAEITEAMGWRSTNSARHHLDRLRRAGRVTWQTGKGRTIRISGGTK